jgi:hypothetical protein
MAVNLLDETPLTLAEAAKALPRLRGGKRIHLATLYRWISGGVRGVRLESLRLGRTVVTSREALRRFAERLTAAPRPAAPPATAAARRAERVDAELDRHGL